MDFIIKYKLKQIKSIKLEYCENIVRTVPEENTVYIEKLSHLDYIELSDNLITQLAFGDVIVNKPNDITNSKGLFYLLTLIENNQILEIRPDEHGLLPIYFMEQEDYFFVSN